MKSYGSWRVSIGNDGVAVLLLDSGPSVNVINADVVRELGDVFAELSAEYSSGSLKAAIIASAKDGTFCAGADISLINQMLDDPCEAKSFLEEAKEIFLLVHRAPFPVVAAISGDCLGGGLELALMCDARIAAKQTKTSFALPETMLGVIPGLGGTQTLPKCIGLVRSLDLILSGRKLDAKKAFKVGLVDKLTEPEELLSEARKFAIKLAESGHGVRRKLPLVERIPGIRRFMLAQARKQVLGKTKGVYPAPLLALCAIKESSGRLEDGWSIESSLFVEALMTPEARNLVSIFLTSKEAQAGAQMEVAAQPPEAVGVIGAGAMGRGIAHALLGADIPTVLYDIDPKQVYHAAVDIEGIFTSSVRRGKMTAEDASAKMARLTMRWGGDFRAFAGVDFVIEAVVESVEIKHEVYKSLQEYLPAGAVIASNTSSIPLGELTPAIDDPSKFVAMHFFNPVHRMQLIEFSGHEGTAPETLAIAFALAKRIKKTPIVLTRDCPGFIVNRILFYYLGMSLDFVLKGKVSPEQLDGAFKRMGMVMGPFEEFDLVGFDVAKNVLSVLVSHYADEPLDFSRFTDAICPEFLGQKSGAGFYLYDMKKKGKRKGVNKELCGTILPSVSTVDTKEAERIASVIYERMVGEARVIVSDGVAQPQVIDLACILGAGITPNRRGLLGTGA